jgi:zinc protease
MALMPGLIPVLALAATAVSADRVFDYPYLQRDLDNGLRVVIVRTDHPDIVSLQIPLQTGSRNEVEPGKSGFAHFFEHMMFRGTARYPSAVYQAILKEAGADANAYTTDDYTNYHTTFTKADLETVLELEADRFRNLAYSEEDFRTEALAVKGEYLKNYSDPTEKLYEVIREHAFTVHPYRHTTMGFAKDIDDMPNQLEYSRTFFDRWYRPEKTTILVVGDVDPEEAFRLVEKHWGGWERGGYEADIPLEPPPRGPVYAHVPWETPTQPWLTVSFRGPAFDPRAKDMPALDVLAELHFSEASALYQQLVVEEQLVDVLYADFPLSRDPGLLTIAARLTDAAHARRVRDAIYETLVRARTERVSDERLADTKARLRYALVSEMDNAESIAEILATYVHFERTPETLNELYRTYAALTPDDLLRVADLYFDDAGRVVVTLANDVKMEGLEPDPSLDALAAAARPPQPAADVEIVELRSSSPLVDVSFVFHTGAAVDPPGKKGLAAITAQMLTEGGSAERTIAEIEEAMYPMAASFEAQVDKEMSVLGGGVHRDNLDAWYSLVIEQLTTPGWRESDLQRVKTQMLNAIRTDLIANNDEELAKELLYSFIYGPLHPYGSLDLGALHDIESITMDDVRGFYERWYTRANVTVGVAGGYDDAFVERLRRDLARLPAGSRLALDVPPAPPFRGRQALIVQKETPAVAVSFGFPITLRRGDPDWIALWLVNSWLGEHRSSNSHLFQRIREVRGLNYGDYSYIEYFPNGMYLSQPEPNYARQQQIFQVWLRPLRSNNDAHFATRVALFELEKLVRDGMSAEDFEATRKFLDKSVSLLVRTQPARLGYLLDSVWYGIPPFVDYVREGLARLTLEDVNRVAREQLRLDAIKFVYVTKDAADLRERLATEAPSPVEYDPPKPELAAEDVAIRSMPLGLSIDTVRVVLADDLFR